MAKKFIAAARERMERKGTVGSLRAVAQRRGLLSGKKDTLTEADLDRLATAARKMGGEKGTALMRKVNFAKNVRRRSK